MQIVERIPSKLDKTVKYVTLLDDGLITEASYINKDDGKDIICLSTHTGCNLGCKFCHTTDCKNVVIVRPLDAGEIFRIAREIARSEVLDPARTLLVSFMGCGEPMLNPELPFALSMIHQLGPKVRFALATLLPIGTSLDELDVQGFDVKVHLSLHFTEDHVRREWMPFASQIVPSIRQLYEYQQRGNRAEIHYALIDGINDSEEDAKRLVELLQGKNISVKLIKYNRRLSLEHQPSSSDVLKRFREILGDFPHEYYEPPGIDVGSSCGAFLLEHYLKYNAKNKSC